MQSDHTDEPHVNLENDDGFTRSNSSQLFGPRGLNIGSQVEDKYRVLEVLGFGGMGIVYKVEHVPSGRQMALKTLNSDELTESLVRRFRAEAQLLAHLDHPNLVKVRDFGLIDSERPFLVLDYVEGKTLSALLKESGTLSLDLALKIFAELCFAVAYAHSRGVIHRDIKPSNIMLTKPGDDSVNEHVKLLDFGIAKLLNQNLQIESLTLTGEVLGSPLYMSPEQCVAQSIDHRSDIYSMGCVMFEALTGAPPFSGPTALSTMMLHQSEKQMTLRAASFGKVYPIELEALIAKMLEKDPDERYQNFLDVASKIANLQQGGDTRTTSFILPNEQKSKSSNVPFAAFFALLAIILLFVILTFAKNQTVSTSTPNADTGLEFTNNSNRFWSHLSPDGQSIFFDFPENILLGKFEYKIGDRVVESPAIGKKVFPAKANLIFFPNAKFLAHPQYFKFFRADDLYGLCIVDNRLGDDFAILKEEVMRFTDEELVYVSNLENLKSLTVSGLKISDRGLRFVENLEQLKTLRVAHTNVTVDGLKRLRCLSSLEALEVDDIPDVSAVIDVLSNNYSLKYLSLAGTGLIDSDVKKLTHLKDLIFLNISFNPNLTDRAISYLVVLRNLKFIDAAECPITPQSIKYFRQMNLARPPKLSLRAWSLAEIESLSSNIKTEGR